MYLKAISLTNFRQFGSDNNKPATTIFFNPNFNVLVGENDSGKTAIIDAIRYLLGDVSDNFEKIKEEDFYSYSKDQYSDYFYIDGVFEALNDKEAGAFLEWLSFDEHNNYQLRVCLHVEKKKNNNGHEYIDRKLLAGEKNFEGRLDSKAREILKATYLKPLRDASSELKPGFRSRLTQILKAHPAFKQKDDGSVHKLVEAMEETNKKVENFFEEEYTEGHSLLQDIERILSDFYDSADESKSKARFTVSRTDLTSILRKLSLDTEDINLGLGNLNLLFIATELLLLSNYLDDQQGQQIIGPQITLIEEIEAHLHTQAQIRLIKFLEEELERTNNSNQFILTSHSSNLVASIDPRNIIMIRNKVAYPLQEQYTMLNSSDYAFIERFLDSTKSNLFFAKGLIFVEGNSEMLLIPALANLIGYPLHKNGISLVNVGGTSFERYIKLFSRSDLWTNQMGYPSIDLPISIITDLDVKPLTYYEYEKTNKTIYSISDENELMKVLGNCSENNDDVLSEHVGLEYSTLKKLVSDFGISLTEENKESISKIVEKDITEKYITSMTEEKMDKLKEKYLIYDDVNLNLCVAPNWTLEYSLALSVLAPLLLRVVHEVRYKNPYTGKQKEVFENLRSELNVDIVDENTAYQIFKPLNDNIVSKAEVAQTLAIEINKIAEDNKEKIEWKEKVLEDEKLKYLIDAIKYAATTGECEEVTHT